MSYAHAPTPVQVNLGLNLAPGVILVHDTYRVMLMSEHDLSKNGSETNQKPMQIMIYITPASYVLVLLCCFACGCGEVKQKVWYDAVSHRIELREGGKTTSILHDGIDFVPENAQWQEGFSFAFPRTLTSSRILRIKTPCGNTYSVRMKPSAKTDTPGVHYDFTVTDDARGTSSTLTYNAKSPGAPLELPDGIRVGWSLKSPREVLIYADNFLVKPASECWSAVIEDEESAASNHQGFSRFPWEMRE